MSSKDSAGNLTTYHYDDRLFTDSGNGTTPSAYTPPRPTNAYLSSVTDQVGTYTEGYYFGSGAAAINTDYNNVSTYSHYQDGLDRKTEEIGPIGWELASYSSVTQSDMYTAVGDTSPSTACVSCQHQQMNLDSWGRKSSQILVNNPIGPVEVDASYDTAGRLSTQSHPYSGSGDTNHVSEVFTYDALNRQVGATHPDGQSQQVAYGPNVGNLGGLSSQQGSAPSYGYGYPQVSQDEAGNVRQQWVDAFGRIIEVDEPNSSGGLTSSPLVTNYLYDAAGRLTQVLQGVQTRMFSYDGLGRKTSETTPEGGTVIYAYANIGGTPCSGDPSNVCTRTDARGVVSTYIYDHGNRLTGISYSIPTGQNIASMANVCNTSNGTAANTCYYYDQGGASAYAIGRLTSMVDTTGSENYRYDPNGRQTQLTKIINGQTYTIGYQYDAAGDLTQITYPSGRVVQQAYDQVGQLCQIAPSAPNCIVANSYYAAKFSYNAPGKLTGFNYGNGVSGSFFYSPDRMQLTYLAYTKGASTYFNLQYSYEQQSAYSPPCQHGTAGNNGSVQCIMDNVDVGRSVGYGYDQLQRMNMAKTCGSSAFPQWGLTEAYDRYGNRLSQTATAGSMTQPSLSFNNNNQPIGFPFDASGNMISDPLVGTMTYDGENRMMALSGRTSAAYNYDGNGIRVSKSVSSATSTVSIFSGNSVIAEYDNGAAPGSPSREYVYGGMGLLAMFSGGATTYYHQDQLSVRLTTDGNGNIASQEGHLPFGEQWYQSGPGNNWLFTTYNRDSESGLDYALARYYNSTTGTFCSADPLDGHPGDPQSWNRYPYGRNNPISVTDPSGESWWSKLLIGLGAAIGGYFLGPEIESFFGIGAAAVGAPAAATAYDAALVYGAGADGAAAAASGSLTADFIGSRTAAGAQLSTPPPPQTVQLRAPNNVDCSHPPTAPAAPPNANLNANVAKAQNMSQANWLNHVRPGGAWDYAHLNGQQYAGFGNYSYGATCSTFFSLSTCQRGAGAAAYGTATKNVLGGGKWTAGPGNPFSPTTVNGQPDYGDQARASENPSVIAGYNYGVWYQACHK